jgi:hypothetical protein
MMRVSAPRALVEIQLCAPHSAAHGQREHISGAECLQSTVRTIRSERMTAATVRCELPRSIHGGK